MLRSLLFRTARRVQRVGKQQESWDQIRLFSTEHAGLTSTVGVSTHEYGSVRCLARKIPTSRNTSEKWGTHHFSKCGDGVLQAGPVAGSVGGTGRSERARLAEGKITAKNTESSVGKNVG